MDVYLKRNDERCIRKAARVLSNSYYTREYAYKVYGIFAWVSYPGVNIERFRPLGLPRENLVGVIGELSERKGQAFVIRALSFIPQEKRPRLALVYSTDLPYKQFIEKLAAQHGVTIEMYPYISDNELVKMYNRLKLTLCAYLMEPFGIVPLESMACETPVVGICEAGLRETIVNNQTGILTARDPREFGRTVESLLENEGVRRRMGEAGREDVLQRWTLEKATERLQEHFYNVLEKKLTGGSVIE